MRVDVDVGNLIEQFERLRPFAAIGMSITASAKRSASDPPGRPNGGDVPPSEAIPLPLYDDRTFPLAEVGVASLMFVLPPKCLEQIGQT